MIIDDEWSLFDANPPIEDASKHTDWATVNKRVTEMMIMGEDEKVSLLCFLWPSFF
jgi:hypothetical protein